MQDAAIIVIRQELVGKSEVQSFVALIFCCAQVMVFLLGAHSIPNLFTCLVSPCIVDLDEDSEHDVPCHNCKKNLVSLSVVGLIIRSVNLKEPMLVTDSSKSMKSDTGRIRKRTLDEMIAPAWQIILYTALPTVRVRTEPAFREIKLTIRKNFVRKGEVLLEDIGTNR